VVDYQKYSKARLIAELQRLQAAQQTQPDEGQHQYLHHELQVHQIELEMQNRELREKERELQAALDKYADLYDFSPVGYLTLDRMGVINEINLTATHLLGKTRIQLLGSPLVAQLGAGFGKKFLQVLGQALETGREQSVDLELRKGPAECREVQLQMLVLESGGHRVVRTALLDVTEQRKAQRDARQLLEDKARLLRLQTANDLTTMLAHELNQPLTAVSLTAEAGRQLLKQAGPNDQRLDDNLKKISGMALRAGEIIRLLRTFIQRGEIVAEALDLNTTVTQASALLGIRAQQSGIQLRLELCEPSPAVMGVAVQIEQVLFNLLQNALNGIIEAGMDGGEICVETRETDGMARVTVTDTGPGVDAGGAAALFDPQYAAAGNSPGLGLHICHSLIEAHGGRLWVEPHSPGGSFHFELPAVR
jgi:C4-dicarboxylate-specific signal transduction histidine kinase